MSCFDPCLRLGIGIRVAVALCAASGTLQGADEPAATAGAAPAVVPVSCVVGIAPVAYFVEQIGGARVSVLTLSRPDQCPEIFEPSARQMTAIAGARLFFRIGFAFEGRCAEKLQSQGGLKSVDLAAGLRGQPATHHHCENEAHDAHDAPAACSHGGESQGEDPHVWLDPTRAVTMAGRIAAALTEVDPAGADIYQANLAALSSRLEALAGRLQQELAPLRGRRFLVYHPAWAYFAEAFGLEQVSIEQDGKEPSAKHLGRIVADMAGPRKLTLFVDPTDVGRRTKVLASRLEATIVILNPLAADYVNNLEAVAASLREALTVPDGDVQP